MNEIKKVYVQMPEPNVYYGLRVKKDTKQEFKNEFVKQRIENLVLYTEYTIENDNFKSVVKNELYLHEDDLLLLEEDNRGFFMPKEVKFGSIDEAVEEMNFIKKQISKIKE